MKVVLNGKLVSEDHAVVSVFDRCFLYGDGLFETVAIHNARLFRWAQHWARLERGAGFLQITLPGSGGELLESARQLVSANEIRTGLLRITLSRGTGRRGYSPRGARTPTLVMSTHPTVELFPPGPRRWRVITSSFRLPAGEPLSAFKTCNKLPQILARAEAEARGADEALLLNTAGELAEATSSNLFWIEGETVCTAPLNSGILAGVMREFVFETCESEGIAIRSAAAKPAALPPSDGVFLTSSSVGIAEIAAIDDEPIRASRLVQHLYDAYKQAVRRETAAG